jgi:hypothetical protein
VPLRLAVRWNSPKFCIARQVGGTSGLLHEAGLVRPHGFFQVPGVVWLPAVLMLPLQLGLSGCVHLPFLRKPFPQRMPGRPRHEQQE